jgi:hypothetical protein
MGPEDSLPCSQKPSTGPYRNAVQFSPYYPSRIMALGVYSASKRKEYQKQYLTRCSLRGPHDVTLESLPRGRCFMFGPTRSFAFKASCYTVLPDVWSYN